MKIRSIKFEISVLYVLILGAILISHRVFTHIDLSRTLYRNEDRELVSEINDFNKRFAGYGINENIPRRDFFSVMDEAILGNNWLRLFGAEGNFLAQSKNCPYDLPVFSAKELQGLRGGRTVFRNITAAGKSFRLASVLFSPPRPRRLHRPDRRFNRRA